MILANGDKFYLIVYRFRFGTDQRTKEYFTYAPNRAAAEEKARLLCKGEKIIINKIISDIYQETYDEDIIKAIDEHVSNNALYLYRLGDVGEEVI